MASNKRLVLVDVSHIAYNFFAVRQPMSWSVNGEQVDTRIPSGIAKNVWRWSNQGEDDVIVCFDRPCVQRKQYFLQGEKVEYKSGRRTPTGIRQGLQHAETLLRQGNVPVLAEQGYEADDLIGACITAMYDKYNHIDVVTGDFDLLPLVDGKVSVFLRCRKTTYAESSRLRKNNYVQLTPANFDQIGFYWTKMSKVELPYNSTLLQKMLQGDESDSIPGIMKETSTGSLRRKYPNTKYSALISQMQEDDIDFGTLVRYSVLPSFSRDSLISALDGYLGEEDAAKAMFNYDGMNLNGSLGGLRQPYEVFGTPVPLGQDFIKSALHYGVHL